MTIYSNNLIHSFGNGLKLMNASPMHRWKKTFLVILAAASVASCGPEERSLERSDRDSSLQQEWDAWHQRQVQQDCVAGPYDEEAMQAVRRAHQGDDRQVVHGPQDPYNRRAPALQNLKTRPNPKGEGVLVTAWDDTNSQGSADYSRERYVWLVLDHKVYPINTNAAGAVGRLYDGMPTRVQNRAGLVHTYEPGRTMMDQLGIEDQTFERRFSGGNPFPMC
jgi:hypothetical protein